MFKKEQIPIVSVCMITYGHEKFIREAIEGVLMQNCNFEVELIIANDSSPDKTHETIENFIEENNSSIKIKYFRHNKNIGMMPNFIFALKQGKGKYIALCEGDDYWNDPFKLQKQVDFLEQNPSYVLSCHDTNVVDENNKLIETTLLSNIHKKDFSGEVLMNATFIMPLTICFRNVIKEFPAEFSQVRNGDTFLISLLGQFGKSKYQSDIIPASYRVHQGGVWSLTPDKIKVIEKRRTFYLLYKYYNREKIDAETTMNYYLKFRASTINLLEILNSEGAYFRTFQLYLTFCLNCIKNGYWKSILTISKKYLILIMNQF